MVPSGIEPASTGYRPDALPLCYETLNWYVRQVPPLPPLPCQSSALLLSYGRMMVRAGNSEIPTFRM